MREIKFRAWDKVNNQMGIVTSLEFDPFGVGIEILDEVKGRPYRVLRAFAPVMQFTGLKDKNGEEIYEGDILKIPNGGISEVKWNYGEWNVEDFMNNAGSNNIYNFLQSDIEIIGNIYENPELLANKEI